MNKPIQIGFSVLERRSTIDILKIYFSHDILF